MPWLDKDASLEQIRSAFAADSFATDVCGITIEQAGYKNAVCTMLITNKHLNALGKPMGGAIYTLADFCLAIISNIGEEPTSSVSSTIEYTSAAKGKLLRAKGQVIKSGRSLGFYSIEVVDDLGNHVAHMTATCHRRPAA